MASSSLLSPEAAKSLKEFEAAVVSEMEKSNCSRQQAKANVCKNQPRLHQAVLESTNHPRQRDAIRDKFN